MENNNLYDTLFADEDDDEDLGMITINEMYDHADFNEISKYYDLDSYNKIFPTANSDILSVIHLNIRNIRSNFNELESILSALKHPPDVIALSETWLNATTQLNTHVAGYTSYHVVRSTPHGGVSILVKNSLDSELVEQCSFVNGDIEICTVTLKLNSSTYNVKSMNSDMQILDEIDELVFCQFCVFPQVLYLCMILLW